jgi:glycosyltransferase involved in cell wall biosynthesis
MQSYEVHAFDVLFEGLRSSFDLDVVKLSSKQQDDLADSLKDVDFLSYDRVVTILRTKKEMKQWRFMRAIPNHIVFEYDACQNYIKSSKYYRRFTKYYSLIGSPTLIVSGMGVRNKLSAEGFSCFFSPKGYDDSLLRNLDDKRDIELAFIGKLDAGPYKERKKILSDLANTFNVELLRTGPGEDYLKTLNRIKIFVSVDAGLGEYMAKNFEAMACGCVLMTYSQGEVENEALGFRDMENVVLFNDLNEFSRKLSLLKNDQELMGEISRNGEALARMNFSYSALAKEISPLIERPPEVKRSVGWIRHYFGGLFL